MTFYSMFRRMDSLVLAYATFSFAPSANHLRDSMALLVMGMLLDNTHTMIKQQFEFLIAKVKRLHRGFQFLQRDARAHVGHDERLRRNNRAQELLHDQFVETQADVTRVCQSRRQFERKVTHYSALVAVLRSHVDSTEL
ncbi:hypothetical protein GQ600_17735 [Phytophthora cactorum]|nr:hypothetical protein GQ600_17735 [Phytophthora cactorum]